MRQVRTNTPVSRQINLTISLIAAEFYGRAPADPLTLQESGWATR